MGLQYINILCGALTRSKIPLLIGETCLHDPERIYPPKGAFQEILAVEAVISLQGLKCIGREGLHKEMLWAVHLYTVTTNTSS
jgi:hypothetical protein